VDSGDYVTIEAVTHHAGDDVERMVKGDPVQELLARLIGGSCCSYVLRDGLSGFRVLLTSSL
jgi:hypothetical protein